MFTFTVYDKTTNKPVDLDALSQEEWVQNSNCLPMDLQGFALTEDGQMLLIDTCGNYQTVDAERFVPVFIGVDMA